MIGESGDSGGDEAGYRECYQVVMSISVTCLSVCGVC